jgi:hypothetical protein
MNRDLEDDGASLIELIIYTIVLGLLMTGISTMFVNMWLTQEQVDARTQATTHGQLVSSEVEKAMRNATGFKVTGGGTTLLVQTSLAGAQKCQAFHFDPAGGIDGQGTLQMVLASAPAPLPSAGYAWQDGITSHTDATFAQFFTGVNAAGSPTVTNQIGVHYSFAAKASDRSTDIGPVIFTGTGFARNSILGSTTTCWPSL